jgi:DNA-binding transcriptional ArsR family regulator
MDKEPEIVEVLDIFKALANKSRMKIMRAISEDEKNVGQLGIITGLSQSALSQHLGRLRSTGLVKTRRDAQTIYYTLNRDIVKPALNYFSYITKGNT